MLKDRAAVELEIKLPFFASWEHSQLLTCFCDLPSAPGPLRKRHWLYLSKQLWAPLPNMLPAGQKVLSVIITVGEMLGVSIFFAQGPCLPIVKGVKHHSEI